MKKLRIPVLICVMVSLLNGVALLQGMAEGAEGKDVILGQTSSFNWSVIAGLTLKQALEDKGYNVKVKDVSDLGPLYAAMSTGNIHLYPDCWLPNFHKAFWEKYEGKMEAIGDIYREKLPVDWTVPNYVKKEHDVHSIADLKGKADIFDGKIFGYEPGTGGTELSLKALKSYKLEDEYEFITGSTAAMLGEVYSNYKRHKPIIAVLWRPHPIFAKLKLHMLEDPKRAFGGGEVIRVGVNKEFADKHPMLIRFFEKFNIPLAEMENMMGRNEEDNVSEKELAREWYKENKQKILNWWR